MNDTHEVISAFLDDEPVDAEQLGRALAEPDGRAMLLDLLALRQVVQPPANSIEPRRQRSTLRVLMTAAAIVVALAGGYVVGQIRTEAAHAAVPAPTRVIEASAEWQVLP